MVEERVLERWFASEMIRFQSSFVAAPRFLHELILEADPAALTRGGEPHHFDIAVLRRFHDALGPLDRRRLRLPVSFFVNHDAQADAWVQDAPSIALLRAIGEVPREIDARDGKLWLAQSRALDVARRYPGAFQFVYF